MSVIIQQKDGEIQILNYQCDQLRQSRGDLSAPTSPARFCSSRFHLGRCLIRTLVLKKHTFRTSLFSEWQTLAGRPFPRCTIEIVAAHKSYLSCQFAFFFFRQPPRPACEDGSEGHGIVRGPRLVPPLPILGNSRLSVC